MVILLTEDQQRALDSAELQPAEVVDPRTNEGYVLVPVAEYEAVLEVVEEERHQRTMRDIALRNAAGRIHDLA